MGTVTPTVLSTVIPTVISTVVSDGGEVVPEPVLWPISNLLVADTTLPNTIQMSVYLRSAGTGTGLTYSLPLTVAGITIDGPTGAMTVAAGTALDTPHAITLRVTTTAGSDEQSFDLTIAVNLDNTVLIVRTTAPNETFDLPFRDGYAYNCVIHWGDGEQTTFNQVASLGQQILEKAALSVWTLANPGIQHPALPEFGIQAIDPSLLHEYAVADDYTITIIGLSETIHFNNTGDRLKLRDCTQYGRTGWKTCQDMFYGCENALFTAGPECDTSEVVSLYDMFWACTAGNPDTSQFDTGACTDFDYCFGMCPNLTNTGFENWNTDGATRLVQVFDTCTSLTTIDLSGWDVSLVESMLALFTDCTSLTTIIFDGWDTGALTNADAVFRNCSVLINIDPSLWNMSNVIRFFDIFENCLVVNPDISAWDISSLVDGEGAFKGATLADPDISNWNPISIGSVFGFKDAFLDSAFSDANYDKMLPVWSARTPAINDNILFHAGNAKYTQSAARAILGDDTGSIGHLWVITDDGEGFGITGPDGYIKGTSADVEGTGFDDATVVFQIVGDAATAVDQTTGAETSTTITLTSPTNVLIEPTLVSPQDGIPYTAGLSDIAAGSTLVELEQVVTNVPETIDIPTSRYFRIFVHANQGATDFTSILEIELASTQGGVDFTSPGMTTDKSSFAGGTPSSNVIDNNIATPWTTADGSAIPSWVTVDTVTIQDIVELRIQAPQQLTGFPYDRTIKDFDFEISVDNVIWTTLRSFTDITGSDWIIDEFKRFDVSLQPTAPPPYSQFKIEITDNNGYAATGIQEIELASTPAGADFTSPGMVTNQSSDTGGRKAFNIIANTLSGTDDCWLSDFISPPHFISVDTGSPNVLSELRIMGTDDSFSWLTDGSGPKDIEVFGSHDGTDWVSMKSFVGITGWVDGVFKVFDMT